MSRITFDSVVDLTAVSNVQVTGVSDKQAEINWAPLLSSQCCAFVLNYTVFYKTYNESKFRSKSDECVSALHRDIAKHWDIEFKILDHQAAPWAKLLTPKCSVL